MIMQHETPEDFVIATGEQHTVRDFTEKAFAANGITIRWEGTGLEEKKATMQKPAKCWYVSIRNGSVRPTLITSGAIRPRPKPFLDGIRRKQRMLN